MLTVANELHGGDPYIGLGLDLTVVRPARD
jgi:hypothetical protein